MAETNRNRSTARSKSRSPRSRKITDASKIKFDLFYEYF